MTYYIYYIGTEAFAKEPKQGKCGDNCSILDSDHHWLFSGAQNPQLVVGFVSAVNFTNHISNL